MEIILLFMMLIFIKKYNLRDFTIKWSQKKIPLYWHGRITTDLYKICDLRLEYYELCATYHMEIE